MVWCCAAVLRGAFLTALCLVVLLQAARPQHSIYPTAEAITEKKRKAKEEAAAKKAEAEAAEAKEKAVAEEAEAEVTEEAPAEDSAE